MPFKKGSSGNPKGRPKKDRALTAILETAGAKTVERDGEKVNRKRLLAQMIWEAATTGEVTLPGQDSKMRLDADEWIGLVKFLYSHIDGPPKAELDITSDGKPIKGYVTVSPDDWDDSTE